MFEFELHDPDAVLGGTNSIHFNFARALKLMAYATAPSPGSRYQPGSSWSVVKYATAIEPRLGTSSHQTAIANTGIWDLDPHQKTVLADDMGVGLALAAIDVKYGIDGLWDCYSLWLEEQLQLRRDGRHRRMPDFLILLRTPISGSRLALLECKGSTRSTAATGQLTSACNQLSNVSRVLGLSRTKYTLPQVGIACALSPGDPIAITVADPPEDFTLPDDIEKRLRANYVALELAALGDVAAADSVRTRYNLPSWGRIGFKNSILPRNETLGINESVTSMLPSGKRLSAKARDVLDSTFIDKLCLAQAQLIVGPSRRAIELRANADDESALRVESVAKTVDTPSITTEYEVDLTGTTSAGGKRFCGRRLNIEVIGRFLVGNESIAAIRPFGSSWRVPEARSMARPACGISGKRILDATPGSAVDLRQISQR